ncbi:hypothetical protein C8Q80DRAFT_1273283 [Daedaleopsis nitida]|nr:hypothetical protein C8Q80DRAFT_1273283 [Daedaleopsis nitida]
MNFIPEVATIEARYTNRILSSAAFSLLYYDFVLTFPLEVERYWHAGFSWASFLFFLNRYMSVAFNSAYSWGVKRYSALLTLRTYALYNRNRKILAFLIALNCMGGGISLWVIVGGRSANRPEAHPLTTRDGCDLTLSKEEGYSLAIAWSSIMVFDAVVFVLTLIKALQMGRVWKGGYFRIMLRDGAIYFGILFVCYLSNILAYALAQPVHKGASTSITNVTSTTLITRLMLNIRDPSIHERPRRLVGDDQHSTEYDPEFESDQNKDIRQTCSKLQMYHQILAGVMQLVVAALQMFRLYALYEASRKVLCLLLATAGMGIAIAGWAISQTWHTRAVSNSNVPDLDVITTSCDLRISAQEGKYLAIVWIAVLLCDTVFFALIVNRVRHLNRWRGRLFKLLLRDGAEYFAALLVCHLANILTCLVAPLEYRGSSVTITTVIASTLIARLMLNLRDPKLSAGSQCWRELESTRV